MKRSTEKPYLEIVLFYKDGVFTTKRSRFVSRAKLLRIIHTLTEEIGSVPEAVTVNTIFFTGGKRTAVPYLNSRQLLDRDVNVFGEKYNGHKTDGPSHGSFLQSVPFLITSMFLSIPLLSLLAFSNAPSILSLVVAGVMFYSVIQLVRICVFDPFSRTEASA